VDRDDIIKMAKQAKLPYEYDTERVLHLKEVERFAALVAAHEREACAKLCEQEVCACCWEDDAQAAAEHLAERIRARGER